MFLFPALMLSVPAAAALQENTLQENVFPVEEGVWLGAEIFRNGTAAGRLRDLTAEPPGFPVGKKIEQFYGVGEIALDSLDAVTSCNILDAAQ